MLSSIKIGEKAEPRKEQAARARIRELVEEIKRLDRLHGAGSIPRHWEIGFRLALLSGTMEEKYELSGGAYHYHLAMLARKRFASLEEAAAFQGSVRDFQNSTRKNPRPAARTIAKLAKSLIRAARGDGRKVLRSLIKQGCWRISDVFEWLQVEELEARRASPGPDFFASSLRSRKPGAAVSASSNVGDPSAQKPGGT